MTNLLPPLPRDGRKLAAHYLNLLASFHFVISLALLLVAARTLTALLRAAAERGITFFDTVKV